MHEVTNQQQKYREKNYNNKAILVKPGLVEENFICKI